VRADHEGELGIFTDLQEGREEGFVSGHSGVLIFGILDDAYDLEVTAVRCVSDTEVLADGVFLGEVLAGEGFIDDGNEAGGGSVLVADDSAAQQPSPDGFAAGKGVETEHGEVVAGDKLSQVRLGGAG